MYLLKLIGPPAPAMALIFTFHYVSIKTESVKFLAFTSDIFTFHYVSIKTTVSDTTIVFFFNLHSTMYLLKLICISCIIVINYNLHSTMYLLKLIK